MHLTLRNVSNRNFRENQNKELIFNNFLPKVVPFHQEIKWKKYDRSREATDDNMAHALCTLDN